MAYALGVIFGRLLFVALVMLVIGGVYYLIARRRGVTFRQAIFRWWVILIGVTLLLLGLAGQLA